MAFENFNDEQFQMAIKFMADIRNLAFAFGNNEYLAKDIEKWYYEDENKLFSLYLHSDVFEDNFYDKLPVKIQDISIKSVCLILEDLDRLNWDLDMKYIPKLISKGYKPVINYFTTRKYLEFNEFIPYYKKKRNLLDDVFHSDCACASVVLAFLYRYAEEIFPNMSNLPTSFRYNLDNDDLFSVFSYLSNTCTTVDLNYFSKNTMPNLSNLVDYYKVKNKQSASKYLNKLLQIEDKLANGGRLGSTFDEVTSIRKKVVRNGTFGKYIGHHTGILRLLNIEPNILLEQYDITQEEIDNLIKFSNENRLNITQDEFARYLITYIFISSLVNELQHTKDLYFKNSKVKYIKEYNKLKEDSGKIQADLSNKNELLNSENIRLKTDNDFMNKKIKELENKVKRLKLKQSEDEYNKNELHQLREFLFDLDKKEDFDDISEIDLKLLASKKLFIVGGHNNWQSKIKQTLSNSVFINVENLNFDTKAIDGCDGVIICINHLSHAMYYKVVNYCRDNNIKIGYLSNSVNVDLSLNNIGKIVKEWT